MNTNNLSEPLTSDENEPEYYFNYYEPYEYEPYYSENSVLGVINGIVYNDKNWKFEKNSAFALPDDIKIISKGAFYENDYISEVILPEGLEVIEMGAFSYCSNLEKITIPKNVTQIGRNPFEYCSKLQSIEVAPDNPGYCSVDGCLYDKEMTTLIAVPGAVTRLEIPQGVLAVAARAFCGCGKLAEVEIPESVTRIEAESFLETEALEAIKLPCALTHIGKKAFRYSSLKKLVIPESVAEIGMGAFASCQRLVSAVIPEGFKRIVQDMFFWCIALTDVTLPQSLEEIAEGAFKSCKKLSDIKIPSGVKSIGKEAFESTKLCNESDSDFIIMGDGILYQYRGKEQTVVIPDGVKIIGPAFSNQSLVKSVIIPEGVVRIGDKAFFECKSLSEIVFPKSLKSIGDSAFYKCAGLSEICLNEGLEEIGDLAFPYCYFKKLTLPDTLKRIGKMAFFDGSLSSVTIPQSVESIGDFAFANIDTIEFVKIPAGVSHIGKNPFTGCAPAIRIEIDEANPYYRIIGGCVCTYDGKKLVIALPNVPSGDGSAEDLTRVVIPDNITEFGELAFGCLRSFTANLPIERWKSGYSGKNIEYVFNYMRLYKAGDSFFEKCREANNAFIRANCDAVLREMEVGDTTAVRYMVNEGLLDVYSTDFCLRLYEEDVEMTAVLLDYKNSRFSREYLDAYEEEEFRKDVGETERTPEELKRVFPFKEEKDGGCYITGYYGVEKDVIVPGHIGSMQVNSIAKESFSPHQDGLSKFVKKARKNIRSVIIMDGVLNICDRAFWDCGNLSEAVLPPGLLTIKKGAFTNCPQLTEITIPDSVCFISYDAFNVNITIKGTKGSYGIAYAKFFGFKYEII